MSGNLLATESLTLRYPGLDRPALDAIDLTIRRGVPLGIVGESGSGKSSLLRCLLGLEAWESGRVTYQGTDLASMTPREKGSFRRKVQLVFQDPYNSLNPRMTIGQTLSEVLLVHGLSTRGEVQERVGRQLEEVGLHPSLAGRYPHELSGGQRQRIGIARAISLGPEVLLADEPVSALDVSVQAQILDLLERLGREKDITLVLIAHDLAVVGRACREIAVLERGRLVESGPARLVIDQPRHPYTKSLIAAVPDIDALMDSPGL